MKRNTENVIVIASGVPLALFFKDLGFGLSAFGKSTNNDNKIDSKRDQPGPWGGGKRYPKINTNLKK